MLLPLMFYPVCGFADDKTDTPQAVESRTANSDQATEKLLRKTKRRKIKPLSQLWLQPPERHNRFRMCLPPYRLSRVRTLKAGTSKKWMKPWICSRGCSTNVPKDWIRPGTVIMRGIPSQVRNLVLLDGEPLNNGYTGMVNWNSLNPEDIARIEVARGPFSSLYGGNAMGGVINILTKTPQEREVTIKSGYGSDNTWTEYASYGDKLYNRLSVFATLRLQAKRRIPYLSCSGKAGNVACRNAGQRGHSDDGQPGQPCLYHRQHGRQQLVDPIRKRQARVRHRCKFKSLLLLQKQPVWLWI